ncbi:MAG: 50S ribosomal protein L32 [Thermogutta sp.]|uniref:50S ribosomal protein L32 n=1 Tax=Thermogutta sp. TaxID=1962930 RepID=UPI00199AD124|nr:50S ribosomal protein L32 [Thermogutta sp.]MBC7351258.1 50S ribosomal protein L32 [Thermogutta sp.]
MAVPKRRQSNARTGARRAHDHLIVPPPTYCPQCNAPVPSHVMCPRCGYYMGRTLTDMDELERLKKQREARKGKS